MRTKKVNFNGKAEELVHFLTQQFPEKYLAAFKVLLDLKYPIADSQVFFDQLEKIKEEEVVKELLLNIFTPADFGLESAINALEKFQMNVRMMNIPPYAFYNFPYEFDYGKIPAPGYSTYMPFRGLPTGIPIYNDVFPIEQNLPFRRPTYSWPKWKMEKEFVPPYWGKDWEFGKDIFGVVAASLFGELVYKGWKEDYAYNFAREKEIECRNIIPTLEMEFNENALFIFASHFILLGKDVRESFWAARFFLTKPFMGYTKAEPRKPYYESFTPRFKKEFVEPVM